MMSGRRGWRITAVAGAAALLLAALAWGVLTWADSRARRVADDAAAQTAQVHVGLLGSELQKFRLLPLALAEFPDAVRVLTSGDAAARLRLDRQLELLAKRTDAAAIYLIDAQGITRVASNWRLPTSFVGQNYGFRPYFQDAMRRGSAELFALGTVSGRPGLYLARRIDQDGRAVGAIIVKVEFDRVEATWRRSEGISFVTDPHGVILVTSVPGWRFGATAALDPATLVSAQRSLQFGARPPQLVPLRIAGADATVVSRGDDQRFRLASVPAPLAGGRLYHLSPLAAPLAAARSEAVTWALAALLFVGALLGIAFRQREKQRLLARVGERLEREVRERTAELQEANEQLRIQSEEREEANARYQSAREDLAHANRLGTLGQITAGVAHEINQPVAAIRTFAENGAALIDRQNARAARENLLRIVALTGRIGTITSELRDFTRRKMPTPVHAELGSMLDGAMLLIGKRGRGRITVDAPRTVRKRVLVGDRVRHEQVLINLLRNALDEVEGRESGAVTVTATERADTVEIRVADNGGGVDPAFETSLFEPFESGKPGGLGLGLAIARTIARETGGDLTLDSSARSGACFILTLPFVP
ncbi:MULTISPECIES: sensor histidine kinase [Sphingomonas]|uniref:sensor histidine kinase n=1 Tax=Sphingomonas TaxID=13687 RepID=UPI000DF0044A|nr:MULTISPECIES: ATP-binding protein [Sphingomonas]